VAETVALQLRRLTDQETYPLVLGQLVRGGPPTGVDRQLGLGYGAAAVRALSASQSRRNGELSATGFEVRTARRSDQQSQDGARRQRIRAGLRVRWESL